ncbi:ABC transporter substrate-binding protein [Shimia abyssi]|uniref:Peptide/nickel transport system substrate-binding protein n=1 Tax=Shimia abyssi TaxID=1662395 RepID=A0A2P8F8G1_9RHOB|nr:ABC transporter substrate-binding protein [Shimia abyssi]PSL17999.1 peptide/nickel transport system substrate-binding protein [Shimia abyssi]
MSRISRRSLLTSGAAAGVLAASGMSVNAAPRSGGALSVALAGATPNDSWDARTHSGLFMQVAAHGAVFDCLTEIGPDGALRGELAESWEASSDARVWTVNLRKGVVFHNGKKFGARDVVESLALHRGVLNTSPAAPLLAPLAEIKVITDHQIQFILGSSNPDFPYLLADHHLIIYPSGMIELAMVQGIGTGLYQVEHFEPGKRLLARRVSEHYKGNSSGFFGEITLLNEAAANARTEMLETGVVDVISQLSAHTARESVENRRVKLHRAQGNQYISMSLSSDIRPDQKNDLMRALRVGINRQGLVDEVLLGYGRVAQDTPIGPQNQYFARDIQSSTYDPDQARFFLRKHGLDEMNTGALSLPVHDRNARALSSQGVCTNVELGHSSGRIIEDWALSTFATKAGVCGLDSSVSTLISAARSEMDSWRRRTLYQDIQVVMQETGPMAIPVFADHLFASRQTVMQPSTIGNMRTLDNARIAERWWHA